jgi:hypothetical protein
MDLSKAKAFEAGSTEAETTTNDDSDEVTRFKANESSDGYALFADSQSITEGISTTVLNNAPIYEVFDLEWGQDLEDYPDIVEGVDATKQQKLSLVHNLAKSTFGDRQSNLNSGYGMGWDTDKTPPKVYQNKNKVHYLRVFMDLPSFDHETLDGGEVAELEAEGLDMDDFGFNRSVIGPYLPKINGERVPILVEDGDEVMEALEMLDSIDWDKVTYCEENGTLQGTPSLGPSESDSDNEGGGDDLMEGIDMQDEDEGGEEETSYGKTDEVFNLAENPERVNEVRVSDLKGQGPDEFNVTNISNQRTLQLLIRHESEGNTRKGAMDRLKERRDAIKRQHQSEDNEDTEEEESEEEFSDADKNMISSLVDSDYSLEEAKEEVRSM